MVFCVNRGGNGQLTEEEGNIAATIAKNSFASSHTEAKAYGNAPDFLQAYQNCLAKALASQPEAPATQIRAMAGALFMKAAGSDHHA